MISYLLFGSSKLLNISDITKRIGNFFKLLILLFYTITYPELAFIVLFFVALIISIIAVIYFTKKYRW